MDGKSIFNFPKNRCINIVINIISQYYNTYSCHKRIVYAVSSYQTEMTCKVYLMCLIFRAISLAAIYKDAVVQGLALHDYNAFSKFILHVAYMLSNKSQYNINTAVSAKFERNWYLQITECQIYSHLHSETYCIGKPLQNY